MTRNPITSLDAAMTLLFHFGGQGHGSSEFQRSPNFSNSAFSDQVECRKVHERQHLYENSKDDSLMAG